MIKIHFFAHFLVFKQKFSTHSSSLSFGIITISWHMDSHACIFMLWNLKPSPKCIFFQTTSTNTTHCIFLFRNSFYVSLLPHLQSHKKRENLFQKLAITVMTRVSLCDLQRALNARVFTSCLCCCCSVNITTAITTTNDACSSSVVAV